MKIDFTNKILVIKDDCGDFYYAVKDAHQLYRVLLKLAEERFDSGNYYYDEALTEIAQIFHMEENNKKSNALYHFMMDRPNDEYEGIELATLIQE